MTGSPPTVYLVDDDERVLKALRRLLTAVGYHVEPYASAAAFLDHHDPHAHGCAVVDLRLEGMDGLAIQERLSRDAPDRPLIFLTGQGDIASSVKAMKSGAVDFLTKPVDAPALLSAITLALQRDLSVREQGELRKSVEARRARLTPREREVLTQVAAGQLNKQIAALLGIAEKTVKVHRARVMRKMGVRTVADLVRIVTLHSEQP